VKQRASPPPAVSFHVALVVVASVNSQDVNKRFK